MVPVVLQWGLLLLVLFTALPGDAFMKTENGTDRVTPETTDRGLVDFNQAEATDSWRVVNDGVMGGRSQSEIAFTDKGTALFQGTVSLENNGGFASVRTDIPARPLEDQAGIVLRVRGDGKRYQLMVRTDQRTDGVSYRFAFTTRAGAWTTVRAPWSEFVPVFRGRIVPDAPPLAPSRIRRVGFLISDKQAGPFQLEIESIATYK